ncbi:hypothetical protein ACH518_11570 [Methylomonas sp. HW2-6]|uniref:hypothetical protein n=1 Tax=Methylomonas sp. HW2-6 TaxID=3376687 RepID=UPI0040417D9E
MSFDFWWLARFVDEDEVGSVSISFATAMAAGGPSAAGLVAIRRWIQNEPCTAAQSYMSLPPSVKQAFGGWYKDFIWAFNLPGFQVFGEEVASQLTEDNCCRFISIRRCSPAAVLWQALGYERASRLPGIYGNLFIPASDVATALRVVKESYAGLDLDQATARAHAWIADSNSLEQIREVIELLPVALTEAAQRGKGLLVVGRPQI